MYFPAAKLERVLWRFFLLSALSLLPLQARAAPSSSDDEAANKEFEFAAALIKLELPEYAEMVANRVALSRPQDADRANVIRAEALIAQRRFKQAEEIVASMSKDSPKAQAIMLALADGYYAVGDFAKCRSYYEAFFKRYAKQIPDDPDLLRFYRESAYKFGQMLAQQKDMKAAADIYSLVLQSGVEGPLKRQLIVEQAEMLLKALPGLPAEQRNGLLGLAETNCADVLWGEIDVWFGRSIIALANVRIALGKRDEAMSLLQDNMRVLKKLDEAIRESGTDPAESPYAGARALLGSINVQEADILLDTDARRGNEALQCFERAFNEYSNVWSVIVKMSRKDALAAEREGKGVVPASYKTPERQKPFSDIDAELAWFSERAQNSLSGLQDAAIQEKTRDLLRRLAGLREEIRAYPKEAGVTPTSDVSLDKNSRPHRLAEKGLKLLASAEQRKADAIELYASALQNYYGVFANYPGSDWSATAGERVDFLKEKLKELTGKEVLIEAKDSTKQKIAAVTLREGHNFFSRKEYHKAIEKYMAGLADCPEGPEAIVALSNLMECYAALKDELRLKVSAEYVGERFSSVPEAAQALLRVGRIFFEAKNREMYKYVYEVYLRRFPGHDSAPVILYMLGEQQWAAEDYEGAREYYNRIIEQYPKTTYYLKALNRIGWSHYLRKGYEKAAEIFRRYEQQSVPGPDKAQAKLCMADSLRQTGKFTDALANYEELIKWLSQKESPFATSKEELAKNQEILEQALFFQAYCLSRIDQPQDRADANRDAAIGLFRKFVEEHPQSPLSPLAISSMGAVLMAAGRSEEAAEAYRDLAARYPNSEAGQNARFAMIRSLLDIGHDAKAAAVFADMTREADKYPPEQFLKLGQLFLDKENWDSAQSAFEKALARARSASPTPDNAKTLADIEQRALIGLGRARYASGQYERAAEALNDLITKFPRSGLFYEARFLLGRAYKELKRTAEAKEILKDVFARAADRHLIDKATLELAAIQEATGETGEALASYQRIVLLGNVSDAESRAAYEAALVGSIPLFIQAEKWEDALRNCSIYISMFPKGEHIAKVMSWKSRATQEMSSTKPASPSPAAPGSQSEAAPPAQARAGDKSEN